MGLFSRFSRNRGAEPQFSVPEGTRVFAIGDVHGRLDLLELLLSQIDAERRSAPREREYIVFLGDLIDRGPDSRGVIELLMRSRRFLPNAVFLAGNHEEMLLKILDGEEARIPEWLRYGGHEFVESYGIDPYELTEIHPLEAASRIRNAVPAEHLQFIEDFADSFRVGDYLFVHAGIRPGVPVHEQTVSDLHWIRDDFLDSPAKFGFVVVHGHTISPTPEERHNRIGIDTGAYVSGNLTALCLDGSERRFITASA